MAAASLLGDQLSSSLNDIMNGLPEDLLLRITLELPEESVLSLACVNARLYSLCLSDHLWEGLCRRRWPYLAARLLVAGRDASALMHGCSSDARMSWRALHQARCTMPRWRELCARFDESVHIVLASDPLLSACAEWPQKLSPILTSISAACPDAASEQPWVEARTWAAEMLSQLGMGMRMGALRNYADELDEGLCAWYEGSSSGRDLCSRERLLQRTFIGRSALEVLQREVVSQEIAAQDTRATCAADPADDWWQRVNTSAAWRDFGLDDAIKRLDSSLDSFYLEGGDMSLPAALRPTCGVPTDHFWWWYRPPTYISGGCPHVQAIGI